MCKAGLWPWFLLPGALRIDFKDHSPKSIAIMNGQVRIEIIGRDMFWRDAVLVEWDHQFPNRELVAQTNVYYLIESEWLTDLERVAEGCFSRIVVAPEDPGRRLWLRQFIPSDRT